MTCKISELKEAVSIVTPITLAQNPPVAIAKGKVKEWTDAARRAATAAPEADTLDDLNTKVRYISNVIA